MPNKTAPCKFIRRVISTCSQVSITFLAKRIHCCIPSTESSNMFQFAVTNSVTASFNKSNRIKLILCQLAVVGLEEQYYPQRVGDVVVGYKGVNLGEEIRSSRHHDGFVEETDDHLPQNYQ